MAIKEKSIPGYYILGQEYNEANIKHDITIGLYYEKGGGCDCEGALEYEEFQYNQTSPLGPCTAKLWRLKFYDDCWPFLHRFAKLHKVLAEAKAKLNKTDPYRKEAHTLEQMEVLLKKAGFKRLYTEGQKHDRYKALQTKIWNKQATKEEQKEAKALAKQLNIKR